MISLLLAAIYLVVRKKGGKIHAISGDTMNTESDTTQVKREVGNESNMVMKETIQVEYLRP